jgi:hypothetical protein
MGYTIQMDTSIDTGARIKKVLYIVLVFAVCIAAGVLYEFYNSVQEQGPGHVVAPPAEIVIKEIKQSQSDFFVNRDYAAGVSKLTKVNSSIPESDTVSKPKAELALASQLLRTDQSAAVRMYAKVYANLEYTSADRARALFEVMWHISSHNGDIVNADFMNSVVFATAFKEFTPKEGRVATHNGIERVALRGMKKSYEISPTLEAGAGYAKLLRVNLPAKRSEWNKNTPAILEMQVWYDKLYPAVQEGMLRWKSFDATFSFAVDAIFVGPQFYLAYVGLIPKAEHYKTGDAYLGYLNGNSSKTFLKPVFSAAVAQRYICSVVVLEKKPLSPEHQSKIKSVAEYMYSLSDEDVKRRFQLQNLAKQKGSLCYDPFVYIAKSVDIRLQDYLVTRVGGWELSQFK